MSWRRECQTEQYFSRDKAMARSFEERRFGGPIGELVSSTQARVVANMIGRIKDRTIVDVGTGSGAIALALAKELPTAEIHATDISPEALEVARANAARHELVSRITFHRADLLNGLPHGEFDFVVSNPPYVGDSEEDSVQLEVRKFEPRNAVFAGPTGLEVIEQLIPQAQTVLRPGGWLVFEISGTIAEAVRHSLAGWAEVQLTNDLQGIARVASARKPLSL